MGWSRAQLANLIVDVDLVGDEREMQNRETALGNLGADRAVEDRPRERPLPDARLTAPTEGEIENVSVAVKLDREHLDAHEVHLAVLDDRGAVLGDVPRERLPIDVEPVLWLLAGRQGSASGRAVAR